MGSKFSMISWNPKNPMVPTNCLLLTKKGKLKPFTKPSPTIIKLLTFPTGNSNNKSGNLQNKHSSTKILSPQELLNLSVILELAWKTLTKFSINYLLIDATWTFDLLNFGKPNLVSFLFVSVNKKISLLFTSKWTTSK